MWLARDCHSRHFPRHALCGVGLTAAWTSRASRHITALQTLEGQLWDLVTGHYSDTSPLPHAGGSDDAHDGSSHATLTPCWPVLTHCALTAEEASLMFTVLVGELAGSEVPTTRPGAQDWGAGVWTRPASLWFLLLEPVLHVTSGAKFFQG